MQNENFLIGIDEAGIGPVLGPLVVSGVVVKEENLAKLKQLGTKDSKLFGSSKKNRLERKKLWEKVVFLAESFHYEVIVAEELDQSNMYDLHTCAVGKILSKLNWKVAKTIYVDRLGQLSKQNFIRKLQDWSNLQSLHKLNLKTIYEKKADSKYIPTSLASILAKVVRDRKVEQLCWQMGEHYISGYANEKTKIFLENYFQKHQKVPGGLRKSWNWAPLQKLILEEFKSRK